MLEVADDGPGLPDGVGDQIFARFVRGNGPADLAADSGTGLGLAIVKAVADVARRRGRGRALGRPAARGSRSACRSRAGRTPRELFSDPFTAAAHSLLMDETPPGEGTPDSASAGIHWPVLSLSQ